MPYSGTSANGPSIGGLTTQIRHGRQVAARAREGFERSLLRKARTEIDPQNLIDEDEFAWRFQRWRTVYFKRLRAVGVRKQRVRSAQKSVREPQPTDRSDG